jgi:hypothetical protein
MDTLNQPVASLDVEPNARRDLGDAVGHQKAQSLACRHPGHTELCTGTTPTLPDVLPIAGAVVTLAPDRIKEIIYAAFDIHVLYRKDLHPGHHPGHHHRHHPAATPTPASTDAQSQLVPP